MERKSNQETEKGMEGEGGEREGERGREREGRRKIEG